MGIEGQCELALPECFLGLRDRRGHQGRVGGPGSLSSAQGHLDKAPSQVTRQPSAAVADCLDTKSNAALEQGVAVGGRAGELEDGLPRESEPSHLWKGLFSPGHTRGCQAVEASKLDNGCLITGLLQLRPECALCVPSGFALKLAVNGQGDWFNGCLVNNRSL